MDIENQNVQTLERKNILWNMIGSMIYAVTSMVLGILVTRMVGDVQGGIFFFAFSTLGQQMYIIAYFGMRPIQVTDTEYRHSFLEYMQLRMISCGTAILLGILYAFFFAGSKESFIIWSALIGYKVLDGLADCPESELQRRGFLYKTGQSIACRTLLSIAVFLAVLVLTKNLMISCICFTLSLGVGIFWSAYLPLRQTVKQIPWGKYADAQMQTEEKGRRKGAWFALFQESKWLFLSSFLDLYIFAAAKYAVNAHMDESANAYFSMIFIPTSVINLMANFVIRPTLTKLSLAYEKNQRKEFIGTVIGIGRLIVFLSLLGMGAAMAFGIPVLSFLLGEGSGGHLASHRLSLVLVILGGGFYAILNLMYYCLVIFKRQSLIFWIYGIGCAAAYLISEFFVQRHGIFGASFGYMLTMGIMMAMFIVGTWVRIRLWGRKML